MTTPLRASISLDQPGELIAAVPHLLGFCPDESIVLVNFTGNGRLRVAATMRSDLPPAAHAERLAPDLTARSVQLAAAAVFVVLVGGNGDRAGADPPAPLPHRRLVVALADVLRDADITLLHAVWVPSVERGVTWWCYQDQECCGQVADPGACAVGAAMTVAGAVTFGSRAELAALLAPDDAESLARRARLVGRLISADQESGMDAEQVYRRDLGVVEDTVAALLAASTADPSGAPVDRILTGLDDPLIAALAHALANPRVRDSCLAMTLSGTAATIERLWLRLTGASPPTERASPAALLAVNAYLRGDGAFAGIATDVALQAAPSVLAEVVRDALDYAIAPQEFRAMLVRSLAGAANRTDPG